MRKPLPLGYSRTSREAHTAEFFRFLFPPGTVFELRGLQSGPTASGLFTGPNIAANCALMMSEKYEYNVYYGVNPIDRRKFVTEAELNKVTRYVHRTPGDEHTELRQHLFIDVDPVRPKGVMATEEELRSAHFRSKDVRRYLCELGLEDPVILCSGSGIHLPYRLTPLEPNAQNTAMVKFLLGHLADKFSDAAVKIDRAVFNSGRIARCPGTLNRKGPSTDTRPHRYSFVHRYPDEWVENDLTAVANQLGYVETPVIARPEHTAIEGFTATELQAKILSFLELYSDVLTCWKVTPDSKSTWFGLDQCPFAEFDAHPNQYVGKGKTCIRVFNDGGIQFQCFHDECAGKTFGDVLKACFAATGVSCSIQFWPRKEPYTPPPIEPDVLARWGVEDEDDMECQDQLLSVEEFKAVMSISTSKA